MGRTSIEWTEETWNPTRGCSIVSPGCHNCYAMGIAARYSGPGLAFEGYARFSEKRVPQWTGKLGLLVNKLDEPLRWRTPRRVFVNSMSDLFHEQLSNEEIAAVFGVMAAAPQHTFQVLTKRARRMRDWFAWVESDGVPPDHVVSTCASNYIDCDQLQRPWPLPNVWLGVSVENQLRAEERIPELLRVPAAVRFLSCEPLLGPLNLFGPPPDDTGPFGTAWIKQAIRNRTDYGTGIEHDVELTAGVDWVIVGSESGRGARPMDLAWARGVVDECVRADVPVFVKQLHVPDGPPKGNVPEFWPEGNWPRQWPEVRP